MRIEAHRSTDGRLRTESYSVCDELRFSIAEETTMGTLVTEFNDGGDVLNQVCTGTRDAEKALAGYLAEAGIGTLNVANRGDCAYEPVRVDARCKSCKGEIARELDLKRPDEIRNVPIVPIFICRDCGIKFYSMTDDYLRALVSRNEGLFKPDELSEKKRNEREFVNTIQEYIIRIFASKRISRLKIGATE